MWYVILCIDFVNHHLVFAFWVSPHSPLGLWCSVALRDPTGLDADQAGPAPMCLTMFIFHISVP